VPQSHSRDLAGLDLAHQRCFNHAAREAVARCPACGDFFCRECIAEHEDRVICAACLRKLGRSAQRRERRVWRATLLLGRAVAGLMVAWFFFYLVGEALLRLPTSFHEGTLWQSHWFEGG